MYTNTREYMHVYIYRYIYICSHAYRHLYTYMCHICVHIHVYIHIRTNECCVNRNTNVHMNILIYSFFGRIELK